jgi:hypothetical protein
LEFFVTESQQRYFCATAIAVIAAVVLRTAHLPNPWPAALAVYVYGLVAWPVIRQEMLPNVKPGIYAVMCLTASLLVFVYENLGTAAGW